MANGGGLMPAEAPENDAQQRGVQNPAIIDLLTQDAATGQVMLVMVEHRRWQDNDEQMFQLQEKLNAYLSFILDGEMTDTYPALAGQPVKIRLDSLYPLDIPAAQMVATVREQIGFQGIEFEVYVPPQEEDDGHGCACGHGGCGSH